MCCIKKKHESCKEILKCWNCALKDKSVGYFACLNIYWTNSCVLSPLKVNIFYILVERTQAEISVMLKCGKWNVSHLETAHKSCLFCIKNFNVTWIFDMNLFIWTERTQWMKVWPIILYREWLTLNCSYN